MSRPTKKDLEKLLKEAVAVLEDEEVGDDIVDKINTVLKLPKFYSCINLCVEINDVDLPQDIDPMDHKNYSVGVVINKTPVDCIVYVDSVS